MTPQDLDNFIKETVAKMSDWYRRYEAIRYFLPVRRCESVVVSKLWATRYYEDEASVRVDGKEYVFSKHSVNDYDSCDMHEVRVTQEELDAFEAHVSALEAQAKPLIEAENDRREKEDAEKEVKEKEKREKHEKATYLRLKKKYEGEAAV